MNQGSMLLKIGPVARIRRNHALEHATLQVLKQKFPALQAAGYSDTMGFWIAGQVSTQDLQQAVDEAYARLVNGEHNLAIHPNCGTNFAVSGLLAGLAAWLGMLGTNDSRSRVNRLPLVVSLVTMVLIFSQPLGPKVQQFTTDPIPAQLKVTAIYYNEKPGMPLHRVVTRQ